ncbi:acyl-CoA synthetase [Streptomyces sp. NBC_00239]|uniref:acyl-CoA synthetase n=1 Tax=Streptomyces sp. NBC_00239 TaxID=2903640 RepID=UPI002E2C2E07|nr:acyl-CoA synthetase [Streptomyces sp. NBC_00239]
MATLFPALDTPSERPALRFGDRVLTYRELAGAAGTLAARISGTRRVALWATPTLETAVGAVAALLAGVPVVPLNPRTGDGELAHILADSAPDLVLAAPGAELPEPLAVLPRTEIDVAAGPQASAASPAASRTTAGDEDPAFVIYTSGTTGPPKGAVLPRRAVAASLDALEDAWGWTAADTVTHALPLFHVHGLVLGTLGPLRRGGCAHHLGRFGAEAVTAALEAGATMLFGVPTMYHRLAEAVGSDPALVKALAGARLLVSGSAGLPLHDHKRIAAATGRRVIERYGMTETLMNTSVRADDHASRPGTVGVPVLGVELRLVDETGTVQEACDGETIGEIQVRGTNLFSHYLNRPEATAEAHTADGWFRTGDMATRDRAGHLRIVGRKATDLIKSGGFKIGAGEIENALLDHPGVREAAVTGEPDADLGERIVAWIVPVDPQAPPGAQELADHVAGRLAPHKRPRDVRYLDALPRNDLGKIMKRALHG